MEENLEQSNEVLETTNTETVELTDTSGNQETVKSLKELLRENPQLQEEFNSMTKNRLRRQERELTEKYSRVETVLNAGLGTNNLDEATNKLADFYKQKGINIPEQPRYSERDLDLLANAEADEIIKLGFDEIVEETNRLADKGIDKMTEREKLLFTKLSGAREQQESIKELAKIGVKEDALKDKDYQDFASKLNPTLSAKEKYEMYLKIKPKPQIEQMGSMKTTQQEKVKDFYTDDEISRMTLDDLNDPRVWEAVRKSMTGQN
jgi:hypothetical protein